MLNYHIGVPLAVFAGQRMAQIVQPTEQHIVRGAGHALARERPEEVNRIIDRFLHQHLTRAGQTADASTATAAS